MMETVLVMLSGGLDSSYLLYYYLKETNYNIHAHHVILKSKSEPRWKNELKASNQVVDYCKKNTRKFYYTTSVWDWGDVRSIVRDICLVSIVAGTIIKEVKGDYIYLATGRVADDNNNESSRRLFESNLSSKLWYSISTEFATNKKIHSVIQRPLVEMTKKSIIESAPNELINLTWSCRTPRNGKPCGVCHACRDRKNCYL
jgi:tRNA(Ile)-lysidine synthase TilS/MesJ